MTRTAISSSTLSPWSESWNACAVPWKLVEIDDGSDSVATRCTVVTASPSDTPGLRLNERVTDGSCPTWFNVSGPYPVSTDETVLSGTSDPPGARTYSIDSADGSCWNSGATCMITGYWLFGA